MNELRRNDEKSENNCLEYLKKRLYQFQNKQKQVKIFSFTNL
jgi:hypothetical protein